MNNVAMSIHVQVFVWTCFHFSWVESLGHDNPLQYSCLENPHGQRSLAGCSPWGCKELDITERLSMHTQ